MHPMSVTPIDGIHPDYPALDALTQSRLFQASLQPAPPTPATPNAGGQTATGFTLTNQEMYNFFLRFRNLLSSSKDIQRIPVDQLNDREKAFVQFLRQNPDAFARLSALDKKPGLSLEDMHIAMRLAGDSLMLTEDDLKFLGRTPLSTTSKQTIPTQATPTPQTPRYTPTELTGMLQQINPQRPLTLAELAALNPQTLTGLSEHQLAMLRFLQSSAIQKTLQRLANPFQGVMSPELIRILSSLIWNPSIYGTAPILFFKSPELAEDDDVEHLTAIAPVDPYGTPRPQPRGGKVKLGPMAEVHLNASSLSHILESLSPDDGHVTLAQLRAFVPSTEEERQAINLLQQARVFDALAGQDHNDDTLSAEDIRLAVAGESLVLFDDHLVLVIHR